MAAEGMSSNTCDGLLRADELAYSQLIPIDQQASNGSVAYQVPLQVQMSGPDATSTRESFESRSALRAAALPKGTERSADSPVTSLAHVAAEKAKNHNDAVADRLQRYVQERRHREEKVKSDLALKIQSTLNDERATKARQHNDIVAWRLCLEQQQREWLTSVFNTRLECLNDVVTSAAERALKARQHNEMVTLKSQKVCLQRQINEDVLAASIKQKGTVTATDERACKAAEYNEIVAWKVQNVFTERTLRSHLLQAKLTQDARPRAAVDRGLRARYHNEAVARNCQYQSDDRLVQDAWHIATPQCAC